MYYFEFLSFVGAILWNDWSLMGPIFFISFPGLSHLKLLHLSVFFYFADYFPYFLRHMLFAYFVWMLSISCMTSSAYIAYV
jgi:hypothetical protein